MCIVRWWSPDWPSNGKGLRKTAKEESKEGHSLGMTSKKLSRHRLVLEIIDHHALTFFKCLAACSLEHLTPSLGFETGLQAPQITYTGIWELYIHYVVSITLQQKTRRHTCYKGKCHCLYCNIVFAVSTEATSATQLPRPTTFIVWTSVFCLSEIGPFVFLRWAYF